MKIELKWFNLILSSEDKLLLYCSKLNMNEDMKSKIGEILNDVLNWDYIVECSI